MLGVNCPKCNSYAILDVEEWYSCSKCKLRFKPKKELTQKPGHPEVVTLSGRPRCKDYEGPAPCPVDLESGMHQDYWILSDDERKKGFIKPVRTKYEHRGVRPKYPTRVLTPEEFERYKSYGYIAFESYPEGSNSLGKFWTRESLHSGCGAVTYMNIKLAETYAVNPLFYSGTFCAYCKKHFPLEEFVWEGTDEVLGT